MTIDDMLNQWRDDALTGLEGKLESLFDASSDVMLEYAEKAQNDHVRGRFYEALREIRHSRAQVQEHFITGLGRALFRFDASRGPEPPGRDDVLSLVDPDDFERGLALEMIAEHAEQDHSNVLYTLPLRLAAISGNKPVSLDDIPAGPRQITHQFAASSTLLHIEHEARLALYTLFERFVIPEAMEHLERLDKLLIAEGVLPNLAQRTPAKPKQATSKTAEALSPDSEEGVQNEAPRPLGDEVLLRIRDLLSARRTQLRSSGGGAGVAGSSGGRAANVQPAPANEVLAAITALPGSPAPAPSPSSEVPRHVDVPPGMLKKVREALFEQRTQVRKEIGEERVSPAIDDVIEIVGAIFEMMLNEPNLPDVVKALLSHLHTPYLKHAVSDPGLLEDPDHPARHWLDDMVRTGGRWVDPADLQKGLYPWMSDAVLQVTSGDKPTRELFENLVQSLAEQLQEKRKKQHKMEKRVGEHARGKARLDDAQDLAQDALDDLIAHHPGGPLAASFLEDTWVNYVVLLLLRSDNDNTAPAVIDAVELGRNICTITQKATTQAATATQDVTHLEKALDATICSLIPHVKPRVKGFITSLKTQSLPAAEAGSEKASEKRVNIRKRKEQRAALTPEEEKIAEQLQQLPAGTRFWRKAKDEQSHTTLRLVWFNPQTLRFMFADLAGQNAGMLTIKELANDIAQGRAQVLEEQTESFFEKALRSFQTLLKQGL